MKHSPHHLYYWLSLSRITPLRMQKLLEIYSIEELASRIEKDTKIADFIGKEKYQLLCEALKNDAIYKSYDTITKQGVKYLAFCDEEFPEKMRQREVLSPPGLYYVGDLSLLNSTAIGIVGTRRSSSYGKDNAKKFASELAEYNITIVSGLATGIDAYAHEACLNATGKTIAVLGMGHQKFYPVDNTKLYHRICQEGLVVSEYAPAVEATKYTFPERNRIIAGLSDGVIIIEAAEKSGALITAARALEQSREIFAVPGNITNPKSRGTNRLIQNGATLLLGTEDILESFAIKTNKIKKNSPVIQLDIYEQKLYTILEQGEMSFDELNAKSNLTVDELVTLLTSLELKDAVAKAPGNKYRVVT
ncbi:MAG: DNA-processing protein DprA [Firmicutes bacterium]|nr:DNA-processing protein DprA [Bacillota bacterium]